MATQYVSMENLRFMLYDVHGMEEILTYDRFQEINKEMVDMVLDATKDFCDREAFPYLKEIDDKPAEYKDGKIIVHPRVGTIIKGTAELGFFGATFDHEHGGSQLPHSVYAAMFHILDAANNNFGCYIGLTNGSAKLITSFGSQELIDTYIPHMLSGTWTGTMCLTEPQAGSSLSDVTTSAKPTDEGYYKISGQKIFISAGDHQHTDNIVHLVLARIEGAPMGTKGISLFVVPKNRIEYDGSLTPNDVNTAGDFQKLGQKGWSTAHLTFGDKDDCRGWLVGDPNMGLRYMFQMMNSARIDVGSSATSIATAAYFASLQYAKERPQGRPLKRTGKKDVNESQTLIINHPDVRRMLMLQKALIEGCLSLVMYCSKIREFEHLVEGEEKDNYHLLLEILTPICKTYPAEMARVSINNGVQVLGGYGFCKDFPLEQYYRDIRIMTLYEGTTGIQSLDLLGRKITMQNGKALHLLIQEIQATIKAAHTYEELKPYASQLAEKLQLTQEVLEFLLSFAQKNEFERYVSDATVFMEFMGTIVVAWQWLIVGIKAKQALLTGDTTYEQAFYEGKIHSMRFFFKYELAKTLGLANILMNPEVLTILEEKEVLI